ncbi:MAG TPA: geranylgeranyl reductase family protein [Polyangiales bacterium]
MRGKTMKVEGQSAVLIVGAGPTGCAAGIALARAGVDVCVVDRAQFPRDKTCGDAVSNDAMDLIERMGARNAVLQGPHAIVRRAAAVFPDGSRIERDYQRPGYIVPRLHLDDCLRVALESSGAKLVQGCNVTELAQEAGRVVGAQGPELRWSAQLVIAADGHGSVGLQALHQPTPRDRYLAVSTTAYYRNVSFPYGNDTADHYFDDDLPYGYGWIFPAVDDVANVGVYIRADAYARHDKKLGELFRAFVQRHAGRLGGAELVGKPRTWSLPLAPRPAPISAPGLLLAGDAAGFIDPLSGEGIWQGLHTGWLAGEIAASAIAQHGLDTALQRRYARACWSAVGHGSRNKARVQRGMAFIVDRKLYRSRWVRAALGFGYRHNALEMTKS